MKKKIQQHIKAIKETAFISKLATIISAKLITKNQKLDGWREAYKMEFELSRIFERFWGKIANVDYANLNSLEIKKRLDEIVDELKNDRNNHYGTYNNPERRKKLGYILEHFRK